MRGFSRYTTSGFSLVELLTAVALTMLMLGGAVLVISNSRTSYSAADRASDVSEAGRLAVDTLGSDVRSAGFNGCAISAQTFDARHTVHDARSDYSRGAIQGYAAGDIERLRRDRTLPKNAAPDSDVLLVRGVKTHATTLTLKRNMTDSVAVLAVEAIDSNIRIGDLAMIYDCRARSYFDVIDVTDDGLTPASDLGYAFSAGAEIVPLQTTLYYVGINAIGSHGLWRQVGSRQPEALVPGIAKLKLRFSSVPLPGNASRTYATADAVTDWSAIASVFIELVATTPYAALDGEPQSMDASQTFSTVAAIRNALVEQ